MTTGLCRKQSLQRVNDPGVLASDGHGIGSALTAVFVHEVSIEQLDRLSFGKDAILDHHVILLKGEGHHPRAVMDDLIKDGGGHGCGLRRLYPLATRNRS